MVGGVLVYMTLYYSDKTKKASPTPTVPDMPQPAPAETETVVSMEVKSSRIQKALGLFF